jgi:hypothetical protein
VTRPRATAGHRSIFRFKLERERLGLPGSRSSIAQLADELGDIVIATDLLALRYCIDLDQAVRSKFNATGASLRLATRLQTKGN